MPPKKHYKNSSSDLQPNIMNYLSHNEYTSSKPNYAMQLDSRIGQMTPHQKTLVNDYQLSSKVEQFLKQNKPLSSQPKLNYSIAPTSTKPKNATLQKPVTQAQHSMMRMEEPTTYAKMLSAFTSPKQPNPQIQTSFGSMARPESSKNNHFKTQPHSHQASLGKIEKLPAERSNASSQQAQRSKLGQRKGSEELQMKIGSIEQTLKNFKSQANFQVASQKQLIPHQKTQSMQSMQLLDSLKSMHLPSKQEPTLTVVLQFKNRVHRIIADPAQHDVGWLVEHVRKDIEQIDPQTRGMLSGIRTSNANAPIDYLLSRRNLPLTVLSSYNLSLAIEPILHPPREQRKVTLHDFDFLRCIGHGGFSQVYLVRERSKGSYYAMKLVLKKHIIGQGKQSIIQSERDIMAQLEHPFIVKMHYAFESRKYLVFVLEYCSGGELFYLLRKVKRMSEEQAFFYFCEICLGMKHLHDNQIVYRDIKPENILIDFEGHVRIADFGLSKPHMDAQDVAYHFPFIFSYSFCGSPEYMAPEMLLKSGHSFQLDLYCLGALLYELITGLPPYYSRNTDEIYQRILNQKLSFPPSVKISPMLRDLLQSLLIKNPSKRISDIDTIFKHPWIKSLGGEQYMHALQQKKVKPPFAPDPYRFNFDEEEFGQGEKQFLTEMRAIQDQQAENHPRDVTLPEFYYQLSKRFLEGTGGTDTLNEAERYQSVQMHPDRSEFQTGQLSQRSNNLRMNTLDDAFGINQKQSVPLRLQTDHERGKH